MSSAANRRNADTKMRIFGSNFNESEKPQSKGKQLIQKEAETPIDKNFEPEDKITAVVELSNTSGVDASDLNQNFHGIRYSSLLDIDSANAGRIHDQKMVQKKYLDDQMAERKLINRKAKHSEKMIDDSILKYGVSEDDEKTQKLIEKREAQNEIREYNMAMAQQKKTNEKKEKEMDQQLYGDGQYNHGKHHFGGETVKKQSEVNERGEAQNQPKDAK